MINKIILIALIFTTLSSCSWGQADEVKNSKRAIICLTYDDGLETQLQNVIPQLDSVELKATFFLNSIQGSSQSNEIGKSPEAVLGWTNAAKNGHELANHTLFHPCPENLGWDKDLAIDNYTIEKIVSEIVAENGILSLLDPKRKIRSFAFPCNNVFIEGIDYSKIIKDKGLVSFGRTGGDDKSIITDFKNINIMQVPSWHVLTGTTLQELITFAEKVRTEGGMGIYQFHGVGGQIFPISIEIHKAFLKYLKAHQKDYLVTTFTDAMELVTNQ